MEPLCRVRGGNMLHDRVTPPLRHFGASSRRSDCTNVSQRAPATTARKRTTKNILGACSRAVCICFKRRHIIKSLEPRRHQRTTLACCCPRLCATCEYELILYDTTSVIVTRAPDMAWHQKSQILCCLFSFLRAVRTDSHSASMSCVFWISRCRVSCIPKPIGA